MVNEGGAGTKTGCVAISSDNLGGYYSTAARDKTKASKFREASMLLAMAEGHLEEEEDEMAMQVASEALGLLREHGDASGVADASRLMIHVLIYQDKCTEAALLAQDELEHVRGAKDRFTEAKMLLALAEANAEKRGPKLREEALAHARAAQAIFREKGNKKMEAKAYLCLSTIHLLRSGEPRGRAQEALEFATKAHDLYSEIEDKRGQAAALHGTAGAHMKAKIAGDELEQGAWLEAAQEAAKIFQELRLRKLEVWERCCIAQWTLVDNARKALRLAQEALSLSRELGSMQEASALGIVVSAHLAIEDTNKEWMEKEAIQAVKVAKDGLKQFRSKGDKHGEAQALLALVLAHLATKEHEQAFKAAEQARGLFEVLGDNANEALALQMMAQLQLKKQQPHKAIHSASKVQQISRTFQDKFLSMFSTYEAHMQTRDVPSALDVADQIQSLAEDLEEPKKEGIARMLKTSAYFVAEDYVQAVVVAREAQAIFHDMGAVQEEAEALRIIAEVQTASGDYEGGLRAAERAQRLLLEANDTAGAASVAFLVAQVRLLGLVQGRSLLPDAKSDPDFGQDCAEALEFAEEALALAKKIGNEKLQASVLCVVAQVQTVMGECDKAFAAVDEALTTFKASEDHINAASVMCIEADVHLVAGNERKALAVVKKALELFREHGDARGEWVALGILEYITGPPEEVQEPQYSAEDRQRWQMLQQGEQAPLQTQGEQSQPERAVAKRRAPREDTGEKLDIARLTPEHVQRRLLELVRVTADIDDDDEMELDTPLMQLGITSKTAVVLRTALQEELPGVNMPFTLVFDHPSISSISEHVLDSAGGLH